MRELSAQECIYVSGGLSLPENVQRELEQRFQDGLRAGLSTNEAIRACVDLSNVTSVAGSYAASTGIAIEVICTTAVNNYVNLLDKSPRAICEDVDGGSWDSENRVCN